MSAAFLPRLKYVGVAGLCLVLSGFIQSALNRQRADPKLGLTRVAPLENAPPVLAFTTVALGGFRGLIANALWIRASDLQEEGKFFEMIQLADWITKMEPHFSQVWLHQAWNMAYNISVKFTDFADRWRWVSAGIELLRDQGIKYNPHEALLYRELAWFFQHKMGQNLDDAHWYYKAQWAHEMDAALGGGHPNYDVLLQPRTDADRWRLAQLRDRYKMDPQIMQEVDTNYGPLDWRLPEASAIYWATVGLKNSRPKDLITLRRVIYQSMHMIVVRGRIISLPTNSVPRVGPDLARIPRTDAAYEDMIREETQPDMVEGIRKAHRNFLREAIWMLYTHHRLPQANEYFQKLRARYPEGIQPGWTVEDFALDRLGANLDAMTTPRMAAMIEGLVSQHYQAMAQDEDDRATGTDFMARRLWNLHTARFGAQERLRLPPLEEIKKNTLDAILAPENGFPEDLKARLRTRLALPAPSAAPVAPVAPPVKTP
jgi:hypothetical protein